MAFSPAISDEPLMGHILIFSVHTIFDRPAPDIAFLLRSRDVSITSWAHTTSANFSTIEILWFSRHGIAELNRQLGHCRGQSLLAQRHEQLR